MNKPFKKYHKLNKQLRKSASGCSRSPFTLIELLAVMGLMAVLMGLMVPALSNIAVSRGVDGATSQLTATLNQARQHAIANRVNTAVVFPVDVFPEKNKRFTALGVFEYDENYNNYRFVSDGKWNFLPKGTIINTKAEESSLNNKVDEIKIDTDTYSSISTAYFNPKTMLESVTFEPTGSLAGSSPAKIKIQQGVYESGDSPTPTNQKNWLKITVNQFTGRVQVLKPGNKN